MIKHIYIYHTHIYIYIYIYQEDQRPMISKCGFYTENISAFLDHQLKPIAMQVKSYIKDTNDFLKKPRFATRFYNLYY